MLDGENNITPWIVLQEELIVHITGQLPKFHVRGLQFDILLRLGGSAAKGQLFLN